MKHARLLVLLLVLGTLLVACSTTGMRIRTYKKNKNRMDNLNEQKDTIPPPKPPDTLSKEVQLLKAEQFQFLTNLIINNMVRAQQAAYDGRFTEAEKLLLQTLNWYPTSDAYLLLGSVYEVQGRSREADSIWNEARMIDPDFDARTTQLPKRGPGSIDDGAGQGTSGTQDMNKQRRNNR